MKKRFLFMVFIITITGTIGLNYLLCDNKANLSDLSLLNVEALADGESGGTLINCYLNVSSLGGTYPPSSVVFCGGCKILSAYSYSNSG